MEIDFLGIDLAKNVFQLHCAERSGRAVHRSKVRRRALIDVAQKLRPRVVATEACSSADHWAHRFIGMGIEVRLLSPQYVTPSVKTNKNDRNHVETIAEAASRPSMRFVAVKSIEQQNIWAVHRMRSILVPRRAAVINQIIGWLTIIAFVATRASTVGCFRRSVKRVAWHKVSSLNSTDDRVCAVIPCRGAV
ncbi:IS110 family transposase [Paraburkholderia kururiensis]|uniref:IS110 family transposase n=1 Tax=Paraburkholderia kururiensis TaxID=984307 RepID=UPI000A8E7269